MPQESSTLISNDLLPMRHSFRYIFNIIFFRDHIILIFETYKFL